MQAARRACLHGCAACGTWPGWMPFEATESALMEEPDKVVATLRRLAELGIESRVEDYGTG